MAQVALGFGQWLQALAYALSKPREIAVIGDPEAPDTEALLNVVRDGYRPFQVMAQGSPTAKPPSVPLRQERGLLQGHATAYVCRDSTYLPGACYRAGRAMGATGAAMISFRGSWMG